MCIAVLLCAHLKNQEDDKDIQGLSSPFSVAGHDLTFVDASAYMMPEFWYQYDTFFF